LSRIPLKNRRAGKRALRYKIPFAVASVSSPTAFLFSGKQPAVGTPPLQKSSPPARLYQAGSHGQRFPDHGRNAHAAEWQGRFYAIKQVAPVVVEAQNEWVVVTVYTFYF